MALGETKEFCRTHSVTCSMRPARTLQDERVELHRTTPSGCAKVLLLPNPTPGQKPSVDQALWTALTDAVAGEKSFTEYWEFWGATTPEDSAAMARARERHAECRRIAGQVRDFFDELPQDGPSSSEPRDDDTRVQRIRLASTARTHRSRLDMRETTRDAEIGTVHVHQFWFGTKGETRRIGAFSLPIYEMDVCYGAAEPGRPLRTKNTSVVWFNGDFYPVTLSRPDHYILTIPGTNELPEARWKQDDRDERERNRSHGKEERSDSRD